MSVEEYVNSLTQGEVWDFVNSDNKVRSIDAIAVILENDKGLDREFAREVAGKLLLRCLRGK